MALDPNRTPSPTQKGPHLPHPALTFVTEGGKWNGLEVV